MPKFYAPMTNWKQLASIEEPFRTSIPFTIHNECFSEVMKTQFHQKKVLNFPKQIPLNKTNLVLECTFELPDNTYARVVETGNLD